jgi:hypothetical protein
MHDDFIDETNLTQKRHFQANASGNLIAPAGTILTEYYPDLLLQVH